jgi:hypothetical protein
LTALVGGSYFDVSLSFLGFRPIVISPSTSCPFQSFEVVVLGGVGGDDGFDWLEDDVIANGLDFERRGGGEVEAFSDSSGDDELAFGVGGDDWV